MDGGIGSESRPKAEVKDADTIFDKIIKKQIPADVIYEDEKCIAFNDISPQAPVHFLVIPKHKIAKLENSVPSDVEILGHLLHVAGQLGKSKAPKGFRLVINNGDHGCQTVYHIHLHEKMCDLSKDMVNVVSTDAGASASGTKLDSVENPLSSVIGDPFGSTDVRNKIRSRSTIDQRHRRLHQQQRSSPYIKCRPSALLTSRFLEAVSHNNTEKVREMIQQGMSPNTYESYFNRSALHIACSRGFRDIVQLLLENGAKPNIRDKNLNTPLHLAASTECVDVVQMLLDYGTNVLLRDSNGLLALDFSIGKLRLSERIISKMAKLSQSDIHKHRQKTADVCDRIFAAFKIQMMGCSGDQEEQLEAALNDFSEQLERVRKKEINLDAIVDQINNLKVKNEIDSDVNSLLSTLQTFSL
ncbi:ankyrin repeat domain-containing protein 54-like [Anopheles nili]|uniref:ankyrin repeat domain-containing protein 54-like n=1 Tax=Anopheles nili TaxID=185578 RepID=UPI00237B91A0|nr:ankyrin repeat domain-containing protein 54-like [Anopheles nili]